MVRYTVDAVTSHYKGGKVSSGVEFSFEEFGYPFLYQCAPGKDVFGGELFGSGCIRRLFREDKTWFTLGKGSWLDGDVVKGPSDGDTLTYDANYTVAGYLGPDAPEIKAFKEKKGILFVSEPPEPSIKDKKFGRMVDHAENLRANLMGSLTKWVKCVKKETFKISGVDGLQHKLVADNDLKCKSATEFSVEDGISMYFGSVDKCDSEWSPQSTVKTGENLWFSISENDQFSVGFRRLDICNLSGGGFGIPYGEAEEGDLQPISYELCPSLVLYGLGHPALGSAKPAFAKLMDGGLKIFQSACGERVKVCGEYVKMKEKDREVLEEKYGEGLKDVCKLK